MTQTEALKMALDEIKRVKEICLREVGIGLCNEVVIAKLEEALAQPEQEPHGYLYKTGKFYHEVEGCNPKTDKRYLPLYTTSPQRTWVGLTDEEREDIATEYGLEWLAYRSAFKEVEAKLKEKNT